MLLILRYILHTKMYNENKQELLKLENVCRMLLTRLLNVAHTEKAIGEALAYCMGEVCRMLSALSDINMNFCVDGFVEYYWTVKDLETIRTVHEKLEQSWLSLGWP